MLSLIDMDNIPIRRHILVRDTFDSDVVFFSAYREEYGFLFCCQAEDGIRDDLVTGVQTCALPIYVGGTELRHHRPVRELDHAVDDRLRMHQHVDLVRDRKSTRLNSSHQISSYAVF